MGKAMTDNAVTDNAMLKINSAVKVFAKGTPNEHVALDSLNLTLNKGDFVTIVGSNGAVPFCTWYTAACDGRA